jgi:[ribosomal protein S5]-alanine N-acetyltransferase
MNLETERLVLRELEESDAPATNVWERDPEVVRYQSNDVCDVEQSLAYIRRIRDESAARPRRVFELGIARREDGVLVGRCGFAIRRPEHGEAEIWFVLRRDAWGRGYAREAMRALLGFAFESLGLHRVYGDCDPRNAASARLMETLGMRREAHLRENWWLKGEWCDSWIYGMLDRDFRA